jgi:hypothetical protein
MKKLLKKIEEEEGVLSLMRVGGEFILDTFLNRKNLNLIYSVSTFDKKIKYEKCFFKTTAGFYLYLSNYGIPNVFNLEIYHKEEHVSEIQIFLKQIIK